MFDASILKSRFFDISFFTPKASLWNFPKLHFFGNLLFPSMSNKTLPPLNLLDPHHVAVISTKHISVIHILREMISLKNQASLKQNIQIILKSTIAGIEE